MGDVFVHANLIEVIQPKIVYVAVGLFLLYWFCITRFRKRWFGQRDPVPSAQKASFGLACFILYLSFGGPLDYLSDNYLFSVHMVQHMLEILVMTPLFIHGTPKWLVHPIVSLKGIRWLVTRWLQPVTASIVFICVLDTFHIPTLYDLALNSDAFHFFEHTCFFIIAMFFWIAFRELTPGKQLLYLLLTYNLMMPLVIFMIIANHPWYTFYVTQPRIYAWLTPLVDQQVGGVVMAVFMMGGFAILGLKAYIRQDESVWYA